MARPEPLPTASTHVTCHVCQRDYPTSEFPVEYNEDGCECCPECGSDFVELVDELPGEVATSSAHLGSGAETSGEAATSSGGRGAAAPDTSRQTAGAAGQPPTAAAHNSADANGGQRSTGLPARIEFHATFDHRPVRGAAGPLNFVDAISRFAPVNLPNGQQAFVLQVQDGALLSPFTMGLPFGDALALNPADWVVGDDLDAVVTRLLDAYAPPRRAADQQVRDALPRRRVRPTPLSPQPTTSLDEAAAAPTVPAGAATDTERAASTAAGNGIGKPSQQPPLVLAQMVAVEGAEEALHSMTGTTDGAAAAAAGMLLRLSVSQAPSVAAPQPSEQQHCTYSAVSQQQSRPGQEEQPRHQQAARPEASNEECLREAGRERSMVETSAIDDGTISPRPLVSLRLEMQQRAHDASASGEDAGVVTRDVGVSGTGSSDALGVRLQVLEHHHARADVEDRAREQHHYVLRKEDGATPLGAATAETAAFGEMAKAMDVGASAVKATGASAVTAAATSAGKDEDIEDNEDDCFASCQPGELCTVCHDVFAAGTEVVELPCRHCFHEDCIMPWLQQQNTCPVCRKRVEEGPSRAGASGRSHGHRRQQQQQPHQGQETREGHQHRSQQQQTPQSAQESQQQAQQHEQWEGPTGLPNFLLRMEPESQPQPQPPQTRAPRRPARPPTGNAPEPTLDSELRQAAEAALESLRSRFAPLSMRIMPTPQPAPAMHPAAAMAAAAAGPPGALEDMLRSLGFAPSRPSPQGGHQTQGQGQGEHAHGVAALALPAMRAGFLNNPGVSLFGSVNGGAAVPTRDAHSTPLSGSMPTGSATNVAGGTRSALRCGFFNSGGAASGATSAGAPRPRGAPNGAAATGIVSAATGSGGAARRAPRAGLQQEPAGQRTGFTQSTGGTGGAIAAGIQSAAAGEANVPDIVSMLMGLGNRQTGGPAGRSGGGRVVHMALDPAGMMEMIPCMLWDMALWVVLEHGSPQAMLSSGSAASGRPPRGGSDGVVLEDAVAWQRLLTGMGLPDSDDDTDEDEDESPVRTAGSGGRGAGAQGQPSGPLQLQRALRAMGASSPMAAETVSRRNPGQRMDEQRRRRALVRLVSRADVAGTPRPSEQQLRELQQRALRGAEHVARACLLPPAILPIMTRVAALADTWLRQAAEFVRQMPPTSSSASKATTSAATTTTPGSAPSAAAASSSGPAGSARKGHARSSSTSGARRSMAGDGGGVPDSGSSSGEEEHKAPTRRVARRTAEQDAATLAHSKDAGKLDSKEQAKGEASGATCIPADAQGLLLSTHDDSEASATAAVGGAAVEVPSATEGAAPCDADADGSSSPCIEAAAASGSGAPAGEEPGRDTVQDMSRSPISSPVRPNGAAEDDKDSQVPKAAAAVGSGTGAGGRKVRTVAAAKRSLKAATSATVGGSSGAALAAPGARHLASPRNPRNHITRRGSSGSGSAGNSSSGAAASGGSGGGGFNPVSALVGGAGLGLRFLGGVAGALFRRGGAGNGAGNRGGA